MALGATAMESIRMLIDELQDPLSLVHLRSVVWPVFTDHLTSEGEIARPGELRMAVAPMLRFTGVRKIFADQNALSSDQS